MSLPAVSKHLKVLEHAGLITRSREAQWRPCRIDPRALKDVDDWLQHYRRFFEESFDRLDAYLKKLQAKGTADQGQKTWPQEIASTSIPIRARSSVSASSTRRAISFSRLGPTPNILRNGGARSAFTTTTSSFDMRPGGVWRFVMHGPDGRDYQNRITYDEIVPPERIVFHHGGGEDVEPVQFTP